MRGFSVVADDDGRKAWTELVNSERYRHAIRGMVDLLGGLDHEITIDNAGQVTTVFPGARTWRSRFCGFTGSRLSRATLVSRIIVFSPSWFAGGLALFASETGMRRLSTTRASWPGGSNIWRVATTTMRGGAEILATQGAASNKEVD